MADLQTVWVVEPVGFNQYGIEGVFDSLEAAKASKPGLGWREDGRGGWVSVGADAVAERGYSVYSTEVQPVRPVELERLTIVYTPDEGGWFMAQVREFPGAVSQGRSRGEAFVNVVDALREVLKVGGLAGG